MRESIHKKKYYNSTIELSLLSHKRVGAVLLFLNTLIMLSHVGVALK